MHYSLKYKKRIMFLEEQIRIYYMANYEAKLAAGINPGVCCVNSLIGNEERLTTIDENGFKAIIEALPLNDCGV